MKLFYEIKTIRFCFEMTCHIYVLKLESNKYYIGRTRKLDYRIAEHFGGRGSSWTKQYQPVETIESFLETDSFQEDICTKKYMMKYGIENVRGGSYCSIDLPDYQIESLIREFNTSTNSCFNCGEKGHFAHNCTKHKKTIKKKESKKKPTIIEIDKDIVCIRCGRNGHLIENCYARRNSNGIHINDSLYNPPSLLPNCSKCNQTGHYATLCPTNLTFLTNECIYISDDE